VASPKTPPVRIATTDAEKLANLVDEYTTLSMEHARALSVIEKYKQGAHMDAILDICNQTNRSAADRVRSIVAYIKGLS
jgi:predicted RNase H-related nuclease YkuK (DUF458 family)